MRISKITLGTVNFGMNYGFRKNKNNKIKKKDAIKIIKKARKLGINSFDTASNYGDSEKILGEALGTNKNSFIATKVSINKTKSINFPKILEEINKSRKNLRRKKLDIIQIHNADAKTLGNSKIKDFFLKLKKKNIIGKIGTTVYSEKEAIISINSGWINSIQVPYNLINQQMNKRVFKLASKKKVKIFTRSSLLKGVLTEKILYLPAKLKLIKRQTLKNLKKLNFTVDELKFLALKFAFSNKQVSSIVIGVENINQLKEIIKIINFKTSKDLLNKLKCFHIKSRIKDPRLWPFI